MNVLLRNYTRDALRRQKRYANEQHDPILTMAYKVREERGMMEIGNEIADYHKSTNYAGYTNPDQVRQDDIDYIVEHRLALICAATRLDRSQADGMANWQDWNDTRESAIAATRP